jgi:hypothetical protein
VFRAAFDVRMRRMINIRALLRRTIRKSKAPAFLAAMMVVLNGCYLPIFFDAEIEITRAGYFKMIFDGYLTKVELFDQLRKNEITAAEEKEQIEVIRTDFTRSTSTKVFEYKNKGRFRVNWVREGDLTKVKTVTFYRRNENMLGISYNSKTGLIGVNGRSMTRDVRQRLADMGLAMRGEIRVITDAPVLRHNATKVKRNRSRGPNFKTYTWKIANIFAPTPSMSIALR